MLTIAILMYAAAMTVANLTIAHFGPWVSPILRWPCPWCGCEVTQQTTALASLADAEDAKRDPLCYACRKPANAEVTGNARR